MRLDGIRAGDIVEVAHRSGRRFYAIVIGPTPTGIAIRPLDRRVNYYTCRAREVAGHWARRGRHRTTEQPLDGTPRVLRVSQSHAAVR